MVPTFRLLLLVAVLGGAGYASTRVTWQGRPVASHGLEWAGHAGRYLVAAWGATAPVRGRAWDWTADRASEAYGWAMGNSATSTSPAGPGVRSAPAPIPARRRRWGEVEGQEDRQAPLRSPSDGPVAASPERAARLRAGEVALRRQRPTHQGKPRLDRAPGARERALLDQRLQTRR